MPDKVYFAYGSNLALDAPCLGTVRLDGWRLRYSRRSIRTGAGVLDIVPAPGRHVWGALFAADDELWAALDRKEGVHLGAYARTELDVGITYTVVDKEPAEVEPSAAYLAVVVGAARLHGFPDEYVEKIGSLAA